MPQVQRPTYNGITFDSALELRFVILIEKKCEFIYHPLSIWYDRNDLDKTGKQFCPHKYEPDFLVRKIRDNSAHLIEIKASKYLDEESTKIKAFVAERYIKEKGYDWTYRILSESDIELSADLNEKYKEILSTHFSKKKIRSNYFKDPFLKKTISRSVKVPNITFYDLEEPDHYLYVKKGLLREV